MAAFDQLRRAAVRCLVQCRACQRGCQAGTNLPAKPVLAGLTSVPSAFEGLVRSSLLVEPLRRCVSESAAELFARLGDAREPDAGLGRRGVESPDHDVCVDDPVRILSGRHVLGFRACLRHHVGNARCYICDGR